MNNNDDKNIYTVDRGIDNVSKKNSDEFNHIMERVNKKEDTYYDGNSPLTKIILVILLIIIAVGLLYYIIIGLRW